MDGIYRGGYYVPKIGHRGVPTFEIENTLKSFQKAITLRANAIELDARESGDGQLVVIHNDNRNIVFCKDIRVGDTTLEELLISTGNKIPTLKRALNAIDGRVEKILVELKDNGYEKNVLETIKKDTVQDRVILVSFHEEALSAVRKLDNAIETGLIYAKFKNPINVAMKIGAQYLVPLYRLVHSRDIEDAHKHNPKGHCFG